MQPLVRNCRCLAIKFQLGSRIWFSSHWKCRTFIIMFSTTLKIQSVSYRVSIIYCIVYCNHCIEIMNSTCLMSIISWAISALCVHNNYILRLVIIVIKFPNWNEIINHFHIFTRYVMYLLSTDVELNCINMTDGIKKNS